MSNNKNIIGALFIYIPLFLILGYIGLNQNKGILKNESNKLDMMYDQVLGIEEEKYSNRIQLESINGQIDILSKELDGLNGNRDEIIEKINELKEKQEQIEREITAELEFYVDPQYVDNFSIGEIE